MEFTEVVQKPVSLVGYHSRVRVEVLIENYKCPAPPVPTMSSDCLETLRSIINARRAACGYYLQCQALSNFEIKRKITEVMMPHKLSYSSF
eukprot:scaffold25729_cov137-Cylindrotheca_fusiformis.AAC.5